ncbi:hypothetical protein STVIR_2480 [Streptomyces viridochromogenes Tue57]|uniref:Uncharacterized protein n=1 Tax=Streptomyces viridochromogenes Tue57 TaxID=1160705 RepID=L8PG78_STRVR|nr:hypothetical protein STVIR_2480 [Streptomyces viridochromogenes Tue57]
MSGRNRASHAGQLRELPALTDWPFACAAGRNGTCGGPLPTRRQAAPGRPEEAVAPTPFGRRRGGGRCRTAFGGGPGTGESRFTLRGLYGGSGDAGSGSPWPARARYGTARPGGHTEPRPALMRCGPRHFSIGTWTTRHPRRPPASRGHPVATGSTPGGTPNRPALMRGQPRHFLSGARTTRHPRRRHPVTTQQPAGRHPEPRPAPIRRGPRCFMIGTCTTRRPRRPPASRRHQSPQDLTTRIAQPSRDGPPGRRTEPRPALVRCGPRRFLSGNLRAGVSRPVTGSR